MKCELEYCIYNKGSLCLLQNTQINSLGMCDECILVTIPDDWIENRKEKQRIEIEK